MINKEKWVRSLPAINNFSEGDLNQLDHNKWINTIWIRKSSIFSYELPTPYK